MSVVKKKYLPTKQIISQRKRKIFLETLARTGKVNHSAQMAGYKDSNYMRAQRLKDELFAEAWDLASDAAADIMEDEAMRRATEGVMEPEYYKGRVVGHKLKYSDALLQFMLKGARPHKYRESMRIDATLDANFGIAILPMVAPTEAGWEKSTQLMHSEQKPVELPPTEKELAALPPPKHTLVEVARG